MLKHKVARGAAHLGLFQLVGKVLDVVSVVVLARILVPEDFGVVALASSAMLIAAAVTELSAIDVLVQRKEIDEADVDAAFTLNILRGSLVLLAIIALALPLAWIYNDMRVAHAIMVLASVPFLNSLQSPALVHTLRQVNYGPTARIMLYGKLGGNILSITLALIWPSFWALVIGLVATSAISTVWSYRLCPYWPRIRFAGTKSILGFAGWVTASRIVFTLNQQGDRFFVGYILGKALLGQYTMGSVISSMATYALATPAMRPIFAAMSRLEGDSERMRRAYLQSQQALMLLILPIGIGLATVATEIVPLLLGNGWDMVVLAIWWLSPVIALQMMSIPVQALSMANGKPRLLTLRETIALALRLPATLIAAWGFGFLGALVARSLTGLAVIVMNLFIARSMIQVGVMRQIFGCWRSLVSAAVMAAAVVLLGQAFAAPPVFAMQILRLAGLIIAGLTLYGGVHLGFWILAGRPDGAEAFVLGMLRRRGKD
ncbi:O-antigen/teichoic acid export membrane protein [Rhodobacter aestuarii]|uniref:Membrane protein involved in the export of O-antigen and teichoic acid n=1 Tax=Rhodobacter aestuarii TaxID=453582 RepID=A0A1N7MAA3_9RHOB|nr:lipopolysaccharide biosynthesis protein [Rhodobacter aestuarii]PTV94946.1 O-antigen/teichoic acid export membrane protein [Rhodobacter aestuarii]SIS82901.1 Membrane protein involved in the export of O-antigen and teichoic acid [Rhodobacter aestuarii]